VGIERGNVSILNNSQVNVRSSGGGNITINAGNLSLLGDSSLRGGIEAGLGSVDSQAGNIDIDATGEIILSGSNTAIANSVLSNATGKGGDINFKARSLNLNKGAVIFAATYGSRYY
jgi:hypothetical protein